MIYQPIGSKKYTIKASSVRSALQTTSIRFERDRIVAIFYFITILSLTSAALWAGSIEKVFEIDSQNFLWLAKIVVLVSFGIILYMNYAESRKFPDRVKMTAVYLEAIPYVNKAGMDTCLDNIGRALEVNDWVTVKEWLERMLMVLEGIRPR